MGVPEYEEFEIRLYSERGEATPYRVDILGPHGSRASGPFRNPLTKTDVDHFVLAVRARNRGTRGFRSTELERAKTVGAKLFKAVFRDETARELYTSASISAQTRGKGLRIRINLSGAPRLMDLPWEYLHDGRDFLAPRKTRPVVRSLDLHTPIRPRRLELPLRVLGIVSRPRGLGELDVDREKEKLEIALRGLTERGFVELRWLERATMAELNSNVSRDEDLHVIHFVGHGAYDKNLRGSVLYFEDDNENPWPITGDDLGGANCGRRVPSISRIERM